jgi:hypothetical protein
MIYWRGFGGGGSRIIRGLLTRSPSVPSFHSVIQIGVYHTNLLNPHQRDSYPCQKLNEKWLGFKLYISVMI